MNARSWPVGTADPALRAPEPGPRHLDPELLGRWKTTLEAWQAPQASLVALDRLRDPQTLVVVTGQQPGIWGGPMYNLHKAATAVALAERLGAASGRPAAAVFWVQGEDTDWGEVGWGALPGPGLAVFRHRWTPPPVPSRHWIGSARITFPPEAAEALGPWAGHPGIGWPPPGEPAELSAVFGRFLLHAFGGRGLLPLDGRWAELRRAGAPLWERYVPRHHEVAQAVQERGAALGGSEPPLDAAAGDHGLFLLEGEQRLPVDPETWEAEVRAALECGQPERLAPSVLLRCVLQDHLLGSAAHVVGHGEAAYLKQLEPVYERLEVRPPARVPRLRATLVPQGVLPEGDLEAAITDPEAWIAAQAGRRVPAEAAAALESVREAVEAGLGRLDRATGAKDVAQIADAARRKMLSQIHRVQETLDRRSRQDLYQEAPMLRNLSEFLRPRRGDQERGLSAALWTLLHRDAAPGVLLEAARTHLDAVAEGSLRHLAVVGGHV